MGGYRLSSPGATLAVMEKYNLTARKRYGQNFLIDANILRKIAEGSGAGKEDTILEIGPGIGTLTQVLAETAGSVVAVEIDRDLIPVLEDTLSDHPNVTVINEDILKADLSELSVRYAGGRPFRVVANLPYYITTPIIMELLRKEAPVSSITVMIQKEVAERMQAQPGTKDYGALSLAVQYYSEARILTEVSKECFLPRPKVDSSVIRLDRYGALRREDFSLTEDTENLMFGLIRAAFNQRRKTLANAVSNDASLPFSREETGEALTGMGLSEMIRGEKLSLAEFAALAIVLSKKR
ncbi:MAG: 16S rRNA (adenine(1518)-N(6)/adenine(1519)-N(6))-dimethyltransferase RsmA [Lachnospiraceae bacterium]|nr:16S rRNA (adenine(1518)-N(6)/adenine(1519)-N(6))-dimethyltransferase RsmA [Lachnospiraceae bacterium]